MNGKDHKVLFVGEEQCNTQPCMKKKKYKRIKRVVILVSALALIIIGLGIFSAGSDDLVKQLQEEQEMDELAEEENEKGVDLLKKKYKDMVGWIKIPKTAFSYPVMQTKDDPQFYLHHNPKREYSFMGTPFLDARCTMDSDNLIIYGHNINGRRMFGYLHGYRDKAFYDKHPVIWFTKVGEPKTAYDIVAVLVTDINSDIYGFTDVYTDSVYRETIEKILRQSIYQTKEGKKLQKEAEEMTDEEFFHKEKFITLSTCRTADGHDARLLIVGKKRF